MPSNVPIAALRIKFAARHRLSHKHNDQCIPGIRIRDGSVWFDTNSLTEIHQPPNLRVLIFDKSQTPYERGTGSYGSFERSKRLQDAKRAELPWVAV